MKILKQFISWLFQTSSAKCPECGAPMVAKKYQTTVEGEYIQVLHCTGCNQEYILE